MTYQDLAIPGVIFAAGFVHFWLAKWFTEAFVSQDGQPPAVVWSWMGFGFLLITDAIFSLWVLARDTATADYTTVTTVAYLLMFVSFGWTFLYFIIWGISVAGKWLMGGKP